MKGFYIKRIKRPTRDVKKKNVKENSEKMAREKIIARIVRKEEKGNFNDPSALIYHLIYILDVLK